MIKKILFVLAMSAIALPAMAQEKNEREVTAKEKVNVAREEIKEKVNAVRAEKKENVAVVREVAKERLSKIRNDKKRNALERTEKELTRLNAHMSEVLGRAVKKIDSILKRIEERVEKAKNSGRDVSAVILTVDNANKAIVVAQDAVKAQTEKTYKIVDLNDQTLRADAKKLKQELKSNLTLVRDLVKSAKTAVHDVAVALAQSPKPNKAKDDKVN